MSSSLARRQSVRRTSPPTGSLVPHDIKTSSPKRTGFGVATIFPAIELSRYSRYGRSDELGNLGLANSSTQSIDCELTQKDWKKLAESVSLQVGRNHGCDKARNFCHVDVPAKRFVRELAQSCRSGIEVAPNSHRINGSVRSLARRKGETHKPSNPQSTRFLSVRTVPCFADQLFIAGRGRNAHLCSRGIVRFP